MTHDGPTTRTYGYTAAALFALLAATLIIAYIPMGKMGLALALGIALIKTLLIGLYFMHMRYAAPIVRLFAAGGLLWLVILFWLTLNDYLTRG